MDINEYKYLKSKIYTFVLELSTRQTNNETFSELIIIKQQF